MSSRPTTEPRDMALMNVDEFGRYIEDAFRRGFEAAQGAAPEYEGHTMTPPPRRIGGEGECSCGGTDGCPNGSGEPPDGVTP